MAPVFDTSSLPVGQKFECRDCASRCCRQPWQAVISEEEKTRFEAQPWIVERMKGLGGEFRPVITGGYSLPLVREGRGIHCLFLDEDGFCSQQKRHGHEFLSGTCKTFPFQFIETEPGAFAVATSHLCPSIRDNYGVPMEALLPEKLVQASTMPSRLATHMEIGGTRLGMKPVLRIVDEWIEIIRDTADARTGMMKAYALTEEMGEVLDALETVTEADVLTALAKARENLETLQTEATPSFLSRLLVGMSFLPLQQPVLKRPESSRMQVAFGSYARLTRWLGNKGTVDLVLLPREVTFEELSRVEATIPTEGWDMLRNQLISILRRRSFFTAEKNLQEVLFLMGLGLATAVRYSRIHAAASGRIMVTGADVREGISCAEIAHWYHRLSFTDVAAVRPLIKLSAAMPNAFAGVIYST